MKKLILITVLLSSISSISFAKTEGNQIGFDLSHVTAKHQYSANNRISGVYPEFEESKMGYGINFQHAISFDNIFLAPEIFVETLGTKALDRDSDSVSLNNRYGAKLNIGYDISNEFAIFANVGAAIVGYEVDWGSAKTTGNKLGGMVGIGASYAVTKNIILSLKADYQKLDLDTPDFGGINTAETEIVTTKVGIAYRF